MKIEPTNRFLLVKPIEEKEQESNPLIILPSDYKKQDSPYVLCEVLDIASDSKFFGLTKKNKQKFIVERRMLQKIELQGNEFYLILENYVLGRIKKWN